MTRSTRLAFGLALLATAGSVGCGSDLPTATTDGMRVMPSVASAVTILEHDEDEHELLCGGLVPTIWKGMDPAAIPRGALIEPLPDSMAHEHEDEGGTGEEGEEEEGGVHIVGTPGPDVILTRGGRDWVEAGNGDDVICTGGGPDIIDAGNGDDVIFAGGGRDSIDTGNGTDVVRAGGGPDVIVGGNGDDQLFGGPGCDVIHGGRGNDVLRGEYGNDTLFGDAGDDWLFGETGHDILDGGTGINVLELGDQTPDLPGAGSGHEPGGGGDDCGGHDVVPTP